MTRLIDADREERRMSDIEKLTLIVLTALTCPLALPKVIEVEDEKTNY